jgi:hypothetical protein
MRVLRSSAPRLPPSVARSCSFSTEMDSVDKLLPPLRHRRAPARVEIEPERRPNLSHRTGLGPGRPQNLDASFRLANEAPERCHGSVPIALRRLVL